MKNRLFACLLLLGTCQYVAAQKAIDTTSLSNGKRIVVYSNNTWKYLKVIPTGQVTITTERNVDVLQVPNHNQYVENKPVTTSKSRVKSYSSSSSTGSHQCHGTTHKGAQCKRIVVNGYNCWQHGG